MKHGETVKRGGEVLNYVNEVGLFVRRGGTAGQWHAKEVEATTAKQQCLSAKVPTLNANITSSK